MSIIEQASRRLEELRRAGIHLDAPDVATPTPGLSVVRAAMDAVGASSSPAASAPVADARRESRTESLDLSALLAAGFLVREDADPTLARDFRAAKRPLLDLIKLGPSKEVPHPNLIQVTSAVPGEGKTFCAINLALSIAMEVDCSVLLVDADVVRPSVLSRLGLAPSLGLLDVLTRRDLDLADVMIRTNIKKLSVLPAGTPMPKSTELLASASMDALLAELSQRYPDRVIIFDAPPLLATTESKVLATRMGQVVLVVEAGRTRQRDVGDALEALRDCPVVLPLLNRAVGDASHDAY